jgi:transcription elongation factor S-II
LGEEFFPNELNRKFCAHAIETGLMNVFKEQNEEYKAKYRGIIFNLRDAKNKSFNEKLRDGILDPFTVASLTDKEMASEDMLNELRKKIQEEQEARRSDWNTEQARKNARPGLFTCHKCKKNTTSYYQKQTRGADEPMTTFVVSRIIQFK